jgi:hypothetical protein
VRLDRANLLRVAGADHHAGLVNLHDWIDEVCDVLDLEAEFDEALVLDVAREAAHRVERPAAPVSTFLLGYAAALAGGSLERTEQLAGRVLDLASKWEGGEELEIEDLEDDELVLADDDE